MKYPFLDLYCRDCKNNQFHACTDSHGVHIAQRKMATCKHLKVYICWDLGDPFEVNAEFCPKCGFPLRDL